MQENSGFTKQVVFSTSPEFSKCAFECNEIFQFGLSRVKAHGFKLDFM